MKIISQVEHGTGNSGADLPEIIFIPGATITEKEEGGSIVWPTVSFLEEFTNFGFQLIFFWGASKSVGTNSQEP